MKRYGSGFTVIEVLIGGALLAVVCYYTSGLFTTANKGGNAALERANIQNMTNTVAGMLQKYLASSDVRFYAFSGNGAVPDHTLARFLVPASGRCADLSHCSDDTSFLYIHYDKANVPAVNAICLYDSTHVWVDLKNTTYGIPTLSAARDGFNVASDSTDFPTGVVRVADQQLLALFNPPISTLWVAQETPSSLAELLAYDISTEQVKYNGLPVSNPDCQKYMTPMTGGTGYDFTGIYSIPITPLLLTQFTGGTTVSATEISSAVGKFPMRLFSSQVRSVGRQMTDNQLGNFVLKNCKLVSNLIDCRGNVLLGLSDLSTAFQVLQVRVWEHFNLPLSSPGPDSEWWSLDDTNHAVNPPALCDIVNNCAQLRTSSAASPGFSVSLGGNETASNLSSGSFSFLKQEYLGKVRFQITLGDSNQKKTEIIDVAVSQR